MSTMRVALSGVLTALGVAFLCAAGVIPIATYALPALSGAVLMPIVIEIGVKWAWPAFAATGILGFLLGPDKEAVLLYVLFFGYYPVVKALFERKMKKWQQWLPKFFVFNLSMVAVYYLSITVFGIPAESFNAFGGMPLLLLLAGNVVFFLYDYALSGLVAMYLGRFHKSVSGWLRRK